MKKFFKNNLGMTMIEIMVALGLMGGLSVFIMKLMEQGANEGKRVEKRSEIENLQREILSYLSHDTACTNTFGGVGADLTSFKVANGNKSIPSIIDKDNNIKFMAPGFKRWGVEIESFQATKYNITDDTATFNINYKYDVGKNNLDRTRSFIVNFEYQPTAPNKLLRCLARGAVTNIDPQVLCDTVLGLSPLGVTYFDGVSCQFPKATCEKGGGIWNTVTSKCGLSDEQKLEVRDEACKADGGKLIKVVKSWHFKQSGDLNMTQNCTKDDMAPNECYCKTKWSKWYRKEKLVAGVFPQTVSIQIPRNQQVGGFFTIQEQFPVDVGPNIASATEKKRYVRIKVDVSAQYIIPEIPNVYEFNNSPPFVPSGPPDWNAPFNWMWMYLKPYDSQAAVSDQHNPIPYIIANFSIACYASNNIGVGGAPYNWDHMPALSSSGWGWGPGGNTYNTSFAFLGGFNAGFQFNNTFSTGESTNVKMYASAVSGYGVDWRNQYYFSAEVTSILEPGDKCVALFTPLYNSTNVQTVNIRFGSMSGLVEQFTNLMEIPISDN